MSATLQEYSQVLRGPTLSNGSGLVILGVPGWVFDCLDDVPEPLPDTVEVQRGGLQQLFFQDAPTESRATYGELRSLGYAQDGDQVDEAAALALVPDWVRSLLPAATAKPEPEPEAEPHVIARRGFEVVCLARLGWTQDRFDVWAKSVDWAAAERPGNFQRTIDSMRVANDSQAPDTWGIIDWDAPEAERAWLVHGIVQEATVCVAFGLPNSLKTWTVQSIAGAVHRGVPWLGRATKRGSVVILDYEGARFDTKRRMAILKQKDLAGIRYVNPEWALNDDKLWAKLEKVRPALLVVDSLSRGMLGMDENDTGISEPLARAKNLARKCGTTTIFIHHKNKGGAAGQASMRGSGALYAATEGAFEFLDYERLSDNVHRARMHCDRQKEGKAFDDILLELSDAKGLSQVSAAAPIPRDELTTDGVKPRLLLQVEAHPGKGIKELLRLAGLTSHMARENGKQALAELVEAGGVQRVKKGTGYTYYTKRPERPPLPAATEEKVYTLVERGITGATDITRALDIDEADLFNMVAADKLSRYGNGYVRVHRD